jgi:hypothetical protein
MGNLAAGLAATRPALDGAGRGILAVDPQPLPALIAPDFRMQTWTDWWETMKKGGPFRFNSRRKHSVRQWLEPTYRFVKPT